MRRVMQPKGVALTQAAVKLRAQREVLAAKLAWVWTGGQSQGTAYPYRVAELPWVVLDVLLRNKVLRNVPAFKIAAQNQLQLDFSFLFAAVVSIQKIADPIMSHNFQQRLVSAVDVLKLHVQHRVDPVLLQQGAKTVFKAKPRKHAAFVCGGLRIQVNLRRPPGFYSELKLSGVGKKTVSRLGKTAHKLGGKLQIARLFHMLGVGNEVVFLGAGTSRKDQERRHQQQRDAKFRPGTGQKGAPEEKVILKMKLNFNFKIKNSVKRPWSGGQ